VIHASRNRTVPVRGKETATTLKSVVLPAPFGPMTALIVPWRTAKLHVLYCLEPAETPAIFFTQEIHRTFYREDAKSARTAMQVKAYFWF